MFLGELTKICIILTICMTPRNITQKSFKTTTPRFQQSTHLCMNYLHCYVIFLNCWNTDRRLIVWSKIQIGDWLFDQKYRSETDCLIRNTDRRMIVWSKIQIGEWLFDQKYRSETDCLIKNTDRRMIVWSEIQIADPLIDHKYRSQTHCLIRNTDRRPIDWSE